MLALLVAISFRFTAHAQGDGCAWALGDALVITERLLEAGLISNYRARFGTLTVAEPILSPWRRALNHRARRRYVVMLGPGVGNNVFLLAGKRTREVAPKRHPNLRVRTPAGDLVVRDGLWTWGDGLPSWYRADAIDRAGFEAHFAAALDELIETDGLITHEEIVRATLEPARFGDHALVYVLIPGRPRPGFLLFDVGTHDVFRGFTHESPADAAVEIAGHSRLTPDRGGFLTVPPAGWAAAVAPRIDDRPLRTLFERFAPAIDQVFLGENPPHGADLRRARVSAVIGRGDWRPCVALELNGRTLYFDPRTRRWLDEAQVTEVIGGINEDLPSPAPSSIHSDSATFGPIKSLPNSGWPPTSQKDAP